MSNCPKLLQIIDLFVAKHLRIEDVHRLGLTTSALLNKLV